MPTDWRETDERLIRRGELILELGFVENYQTELDAMNHGKEGRPYNLTPATSSSWPPYDTSTGCPTASSKDSPAAFTHLHPGFPQQTTRG